MYSLVDTVLSHWGLYMAIERTVSMCLSRDFISYCLEKLNAREQRLKQTTEQGGQHGTKK